MSDFLKRVREEHREVAGRLDELSKFMQSDSFKALSKTHQNLMTMQGLAMSQYIATLLSRIEDIDG